MLQQGVIDGIFMPMAQQKSLRLNEVTKYITVFPAGMYMGSFSMFINPEFMEDLDDRDREAILAVSGEKLSAMAGRAWEEGDMEGYEEARKAGVEINELSADSPLAVEFNKMISGMDQIWVESVADREVDGPAVMKELRDIAHTYKPAQSVAAEE